MITRTASDQITAAATMLTLVTTFGDLPAAQLSLWESSATWGVRVSVHDGLGIFEQWREALGVDPASVDQDQIGDRGWLVAIGTWGAGVLVELVGYYTVPDAGDDE